MPKTREIFEVNMIVGEKKYTYPTGEPGPLKYKLAWKPVVVTKKGWERMPSGYKSSLVKREELEDGYKLFFQPSWEFATNILGNQLVKDWEASPRRVKWFKNRKRAMKKRKHWATISKEQAEKRVKVQKEKEEKEKADKDARIHNGQLNNANKKREASRRVTRAKRKTTAAERRVVRAEEQRCEAVAALQDYDSGSELELELEP